MLASIRAALCETCIEPATERVSSKALDDARTCIQRYTGKVTICDRPYQNQAGLCQYRYDENRSSIRARRVETARQLGVTLSDAPFTREFAMALAARVEETEHMPGQCAEMACVAAVSLKPVAARHHLKVYTVQLPDSNHTIVLLSGNHYRPQQWIDWNSEFKASSVVVDLWQGALSKHDPTALAAPARLNSYTRTEPRALVQCMIWDEYSSRDRA